MSDDVTDPWSRFEAIDREVNDALAAPADPPAALTALAAALHDEFDYECCFVKWPDGTSEHSTGAKYWPTRAARVLANLLALPASERDALAAVLLERMRTRDAITEALHVRSHANDGPDEFCIGTEHERTFEAEATALLDPFLRALREPARP